MENKFNKQPTICWSCANATGNCTWSSRLKPVKGWKAEKTTIKCTPTETMESYRVKSCPCFKKDRDDVKYQRNCCA